MSGYSIKKIQPVFYIERSAVNWYGYGFNWMGGIYEGYHPVNHDFLIEFHITKLPYFYDEGNVPS